MKNVIIQKLCGAIVRAQLQLYDGRIVLIPSLGSKKIHQLSIKGYS